MIRRVAPGTVVDPSPSPRGDPIPVSFVIWSPAGVDVVGKPYVAVGGIVSPVAVVVEVVISDFVMRQILRRTRVVVPVVAGFGPAIELIGPAELFYIRIQRVGAAEGATLPAMQCVRLSITGGLAFAFADCDDGVRFVFACVQAIMSRLHRGERKVRCIDFEIVVVVQSTHGDAERTGGQLDLNGIVVQAEEGKSCHRRQANDGGSELDFYPRVAVSPEFIAGRHGTVGHGTNPIFFSRRLEGNRTFHIAEASDPAGGIFLILILSRYVIWQNYGGEGKREHRAAPSKLLPCCSHSQLFSQALCAK